MVIKKILLIASFLLILIHINANTTYFKHLGVQDGLSQINIISIYQDETGAMWLGSLEGINRYNGQNVTVFPPSQDKSGLSQNEIMAICGDKKGSVYIQALHDLIRFDIKKQQFHTLLSNNVFNIHHHKDTLWIVTDTELCYRTDNDSLIHTFTTFPKNVNGFTPICPTDKGYIYAGTSEGLLRIPYKNPEKKEILLPGVKVQSIYQDSKKNIWIGTRKDGVYQLSPEGEIRNNFRNQPKQSNSLSHNDVRCIVEDNFGNLWFGTFYGLNQYTPQKDQWKLYVNQNNISYSLSHSSVFALYKDTQGGIWIGTYFGGVNYFNPASNYSNFYGANPDNPRALSFPFVGKMQEDNAHNLWICTEGGGLNLLDRKTKQFTCYTSKNDPSSIGHNNLKCIWFQKETGKLYIGTHTGGLTIFDTEKRIAHTLKNIPGNTQSLPSDVVNDMQYYRNRLIVSTQAGIFAMNLESERFEPLSTNNDTREMVENYTYETFLIDRKQNIWLANGNGGITKINLPTGVRKKYQYDSSDPHSIGRFKVLHILENKKGEIYFATAGSGLFRYESNQDCFTRYSKEDKRLMSNYCYYLAEGPSQELIVLHNQGISSLNTNEGKLNYTHQIPHMSFCKGSSIFVTQDGEILLGGANGLISLTDKQKQISSSTHSIYFDQLIVNNKTIEPDDDSGILQYTMPFTESIDLDHDQNNITLEFATSDYIQNTYHYEYRLEGFNDTWLPLYSFQIVYSNLDPGTYKLTIRELNNDKKVCGECSLAIHIRPPFYANIYAYSLYLLIICFLLYAFIRFNNRQARLKASLEFERKEKDRIKELNQTKLRFFTNISHEFRTPLTLIISQVESLLQLSKLPPNIYNRMLRIYKNANHMRTLISELLDFRKQEQGYLKLKVECRDIITFTKEVYMSFYEYALKKKITYKFEAPEQQILLWFDPSQMQKVIINLLSNAFKHTEAEGCISVIISIHSQQVSIRIKDNGSGIPAESIHYIFDRFYQIDGQTNQFSLGTGIGLALTKSIVELHKGSIRVESEVKEGSCFTVFLKTGSEHFNAEDMQNDPSANCIAHTELIPLEEPTAEEVESTEEVENDAPIKKPTILIVEDNPDILDVLEEIFLPTYEVHKALNGNEGFEQTRQVLPDIVLSDVMMPGMSGKEMCYKIKNSVDLSHIPVVLLTAQTSVEYAIEGYMYGADDYITKPFNIKLLISRCNNLVKSRKVLIEKFRNQQEGTIHGNAINQSDLELLERTSEIIKQNFENEEFNMNELATQLGLGRNKLYTRIKELTGLTPNELTLKLKLDESIHLLKNHTELNISEISDRLGFSSTQYFSKCFKSFFGVAPLTYRKADPTSLKHQ